MLRRLYHDQPDSFAFTPANEAWAKAQISKYPEGRQASAVIPLLWRAQEQEGWLSRPAIEYVAGMLDMAYIRALEVATFYFMFQLQPVGSVAHIQVCGTTSCMICGAEDLIGVCKEKIAAKPHAISDDGKFSWEEVECLGACANAPMVQIGKDYYEDLTTESFAALLDDFAAGRVPTPGSQTGRFASEPASGLTSLKEYEAGKPAGNASVALATELGDTIKRIDGTEVPIVTSWVPGSQPQTFDNVNQEPTEEEAKAAVPVPPEAIVEEEAARPDPFEVAAATEAEGKAVPKSPVTPSTALSGEADLEARRGHWRYEVAQSSPERPAGLDAPRDGAADDLKRIKGIGPKLEDMLNGMGFYHYDQIAAWTPAEVAWVDDNLEGFKGRVTRDDWISQAQVLASGGETDFSKRAKT